MARTLDPATREALIARVRFYRDLGLTEFYRRPIDPALAVQLEAEAMAAQEREPDSAGDLRSPSFSRPSAERVESMTSKLYPINPLTLRRIRLSRPASLSPLHRNLPPPSPPRTALPPCKPSAKRSATAPAAPCTRAATSWSLATATPPHG